MAQGKNRWDTAADNADAMQRRWQADANRWKTMLSTINQTQPETLLGYGLGQLLRGAYEHRRTKAKERANSDVLNGGSNGQGNADSLNNITVDVLSTATPSQDAIYGIAPQKGLLGDKLGGGVSQAPEYFNRDKLEEAASAAIYPQPEKQLTLTEMAATVPMTEYARKRQNPLGNYMFPYQ